MKETRFRVWDVKRKRMLDRECIVLNDGDYYKDYRDFEDGTALNNIVVMQYTGIKDKDGVQIFEGDIVRYFRNELAVIVYRHGGVDIRSLSWGGCEPLQRRFGEIEVIGNIYQNKELLESKKD